MAEIDDGSIGSRIRKELECVLCLSLICEPITIACGHSFCRCCLVKALRRSKKKCPTCRAICHISAESSEESMMLKSLAMITAPEEYQERLLEATAEKASWDLLHPIFYYNEALFPGSRLDLHLFEPRYRVMMKRVVETTRSFAYVPNFRSYSASVGDPALIAKVDECEFYADGRAMIQAKIGKRYTITEHYVEEGTQGLHYCRLAPLHDDAMDEEQLSQATSLVEVSHVIWGSLFSRNVKDRLEWRFGKAPVVATAGPEMFSLWMVAVSPLPESEKNRLLSSKDTVERLRLSVGCFAAMMRRVDRNPNPDPNQPPPAVAVVVAGSQSSTGGQGSGSGRGGGGGGEGDDEELPALINEDGDEVDMDEEEEEEEEGEEDDDDEEEDEEEEEDDDDEYDDDDQDELDPMRALLAQEIAWGQMMAREVLARNNTNTTTTTTTSSSSSSSSQAGPNTARGGLGPNSAPGVRVGGVNRRQELDEGEEQEGDEEGDEELDEGEEGRARKRR